MEERLIKLFKTKCGERGLSKLMAVNNPSLHEFLAKYIELCKPETVFIRSGAPEDAEYIKDRALENGEERKLSTEGHTVHFDGFRDQARDTMNTKYLLPPDVDLGADIRSLNREEGLTEMNEYLRNIMEWREMYVCFFCLGPVDSEFSIPAVQITDSSYVAHSEDILIRNGYEYFKRVGPAKDFFKFVHSAGELENGVSKNIGKRRVYIDLEDNIVFSVNTQYAGNTVGLKKLAMRLAIKKSSFEGWLTEHMFVMGVHGPSSRVTYFTGSFPSACGKTATAMLEGETIIGDDIAYLKKIDGKVRAANVECGIFGIIQDVNAKDNPLIWEAITTPGEVIFSNILVTDEGVPCWLGDGREIPGKGVNYSGSWHKGKKDKEGNNLSHSHKNARFTVSINRLKNRDPLADDPGGVEVGGIIYGGRDSDTSVPVEEAFDWNHGILTKGAMLESETTAATLGKEGVRKFNLMANIDFLSIPMGRYISNNCDMGKGLKAAPKIFSINYFLRDKDGKYLSDMEDKRIWLKWMELRVHGDAKVIKTPTGYIPEYEELKRLFQEVLRKDYRRETYLEQFQLRIPENLSKIERIVKIYKTKVPDAPHFLFKAIDEQKKRLLEARQQYGDYVSPDQFR